MKKVIVAILLVSTLAVAKPKKLTTAYTLSGVGTGASVALIAGAFLLPPHSGDIYLPMLYTGLATSVITPSLGNLYTENWLNLGMGIRLGAGALAVYSIATQRQEVQCGLSTPMTCKRITNTGVTMLGIAGIVYVGGAALDFKFLREHVDAYNAKHRFNWAPTITPSPTGTGALLGLGGTF